MAGDYDKLRRAHANISGSAIITTDAGGKTLVTGRANHTIHIQSAHMQVTKPAEGGSWQLIDSAHVELTGLVPTDAAGAMFDREFGAMGSPLTEGADLVLQDTSRATGYLVWEGYLRPSSTMGI